MTKTIYHDTLVYYLSNEQIMQLMDGAELDVNRILKGYAKLLIGRIIGRKIKKYFMLIEVIDYENYVALKRSWA